MCRTEGDGRVHPAELLAIQAAARSSDGLLEEAPDGAVRGDDAEDSERSSEAQGDPQGAQWLAAVHHDVHPAAEQQQQAQVGEGDIDYRGDPERAGVAAVIVCCDANQHGPYTTPKLGQTLHYVKFLPTARGRHSMPEGCDSNSQANPGPRLPLLFTLPLLPPSQSTFSSTMNLPPLVELTCPSRYRMDSPLNASLRDPE